MALAMIPSSQPAMAGETLPPKDGSSGVVLNTLSIEELRTLSAEKQQIIDAMESQLSVLQSRDELYKHLSEEAASIRRLRACGRLQSSSI